MTPTSLQGASADAGLLTLERIGQTLGAYNRWMAEQVSPAVRGNLLEVSGGVGNLTRVFASDPRVTALSVTDVDPACLARLEREFSGRAAVSPWNLDEPVPAGVAARGPFDGIVCLNVLEHIEDDRAVLDAFRGLLAPGGTLALLVPAHPRLFNGFDRGVGHFRRYTRPGLEALLAEAGFAVERLWAFNMLGALGWYVNGNLLGKTVLPEAQLALFDRLVPLLRLEARLPRPFGISYIALAHALEG